MNLTTLYYKKQNSRPIQIAKIPPFDYCKAIKKSITNPLLRIMLQFLKETQPDMVHECPYSVNQLN